MKLTCSRPVWQCVLLSGLIFCGICFAASCTIPHYMYAPTAAGVPSFTGKHTSQISGSLSARGFDLQAGYALTGHFGVWGSWYRRSERDYARGYRPEGLSGYRTPDSVRYGRGLASLGAVYYTPVDQWRRFFFSVSAGYGTGYFRMISHIHRKSSVDSTGIYEDYAYRARMRRIYVQPAFMHRFEHWSVTISVRWSGTVYQDVRSPDPDLYGHVSNQLLSFVEPAMTWKLSPGPDWLMISAQAGVSLHTPAIDYRYRPLIGNIGVSVDPVKLLGKKEPFRQTHHHDKFYICRNHQTIAMHIHKEGYPTIGITLGVLIIINVLVWLSAGEALSWVVTGLSILLFLCIVSFFRIPHRVMITNEHYVIAPADGKVVAIEETVEPEYFKGKRLQVSIFMSPANVHVNRNPVSGEVRLSAYHPGKYLVAWHPKSSTLNEHHTVVLRHRHGDILVRQIAGAMARRIVNYLEPGMEVSQNAEMGFIKFGSRVDLLLPLTAKLEVKLNQKVKGGQTVIAELLQPGNSV